MRSFIVVWLALLATIATAQESVPKSLQGYWVPGASSCKSTLGVVVAAGSIELRGAKRTLSIPTQACFSCEGGARYSGIVVWISPTAMEQPGFTLYLNYEERKGVAKVEFDAPERWPDFPIHQAELRRCEG